MVAGGSGMEGGGKKETKQIFTDCKNPCFISNIYIFKGFKHTMKFSSHESSGIKSMK